ncbi:Hvo_1808 family surface protein [Haloarcula amylovorans]|uniref:Hvo_1808 family surface protein n=1 Tax=Haloarcula amylovorans TaxID=2562280 RepID=UPI0010765569|nr:Hvo_1808 family surface protein [Halomicroarcula amylolytica]
MRRELLLALTIVLAGCTVPSFGGSGSDHPATPEGGDTLGWENGYWYDDSVSVTTEDGLNASEREAVTARTMARLERIREREFTQPVPVEVISRAEYRNRSRGNQSGAAGPPADPWNDQVWESLLLIGEDEGSSEAIDNTLSSSVQGFYSPSRDRIVIVSPTETPQVDRGTLSHELTHALQDQQFGLNTSAKTQDTQLSTDGAIEGEANYIQALYRNRCDGQWSCIANPETSGGGGGSSSMNPGLFTVIIQPYASGPRFVDSIREDGGWDAVDALHRQYPNSTEQVIHPDRYPDEEPVEVTVPDRSNDEWSRFDHDPVGDTVGEASIFATMYHNNQTDADRYSYVSDPSEGWAGDKVVPYKNGSGGGGYVWVSTWDSEDDAREFAQAYRAALVEEHGATQPRENVYVVPESSSFEDAFRITQSGDTVRIVNGPTIEDLRAIHRPQ